MNSANPAVGTVFVAEEAYARAERFLHWNADVYCRNLDVAYRWIGTTDRFWYLRRTETGKRFVVVDASSGKASAAFDHSVVAGLLSKALRATIDPENLPFDEFEFCDSETSIRFSISGEHWVCCLDVPACSRVPKNADHLAGLLSPDSRWLLYRDGYDLWLRSVDGRTKKRLTEDGEVHFAYGSVPGCSAGFRSFLHRSAEDQIPIALWSPDSKKVLTYQLDERGVQDLHLLEMAPRHGVRPVLHQYRYAMPGDSHFACAKLVILDVESGRSTVVRHPPIPVTMLDPIQDDRMWWDQHGSSVYVIPREIGQRRVQLLWVDAETGEVRRILEEHADTYVEIAGSIWDRAVRTLSDGTIIWYSERTDWGHLYLYARDGRLKHAITSGPWKVIDVVRVDEQAREIYFTAVGREPGEDPYQRHLYVVGFDGDNVRLLTPENAEHDIRISCDSEVVRRLMPGKLGADRASFSPSGKYFVDCYSRPDLPTTTVVRTSAGELIGVIERADISALEAGGFRKPEPFEVLAGDGVTPLYGTIHWPSTFDPDKKYPVIDVVYPGPQMLATPKTFKASLYGLYEAMCTQALAELGFVVVTMDGRGTPMRSKSFHDLSYGRMEQAGHLEDHIAALQQLATRYPCMDLSRVGITGHSGGGFASTRAILMYPGFYKVAVSLAGNHDQRGYLLVWGPTYQGPYNDPEYERIANGQLAASLRGKLLLMHGELDDNVHPALTMQLAGALIRAGKDFECLLLPGEDHMFGRGTLPYVHHKTWDYFVRHLLGEEPPDRNKTPGSRRAPMVSKDQSLVHKVSAG